MKLNIRFRAKSLDNYSFAENTSVWQMKCEFIHAIGLNIRDTFNYRMHLNGNAVPLKDSHLLSGEYPVPTFFELRTVNENLPTNMKKSFMPELAKLNTEKLYKTIAQPEVNFNFHFTTDDIGESPITAVANSALNTRSKIELIQELVKNGAYIDYRNKSGLTVLLVAIARFDLELCSQLIELEPGLVMLPDLNGNAPLSAFFKETSSDGLIYDTKGQSSQHDLNHSDIVEAMRRVMHAYATGPSRALTDQYYEEFTADPLLGVQRHLKEPVIHTICQKNQDKLLDAVLGIIRDDAANATSQQQHKQQLDEVVNCTHAATGDTPLMVCAREGHEACAQLLMEANCSVTQSNNLQMTAMMIAFVEQKQNVQNAIKSWIDSKRNSEMSNRSSSPTPSQSYSSYHNQQQQRDSHLSHNSSRFSRLSAATSEASDRISFMVDDHTNSSAGAQLQSQSLLEESTIVPASKPLSPNPSPVKSPPELSEKPVKKNSLYVEGAPPRKPPLTLPPKTMLKNKVVPQSEETLQSDSSNRSSLYAEVDDQPIQVFQLIDKQLPFKYDDCAQPTQIDNSLKDSLSRNTALSNSNRKVGPPVPSKPASKPKK